MPQEASRCHLEECWRQARWESCSFRPSTSRILWQLTCVGAAGFYVVGIPGLFWGANTRYCFGLTSEDSKLKHSPRCNQRNQTHLKLFKHILFRPGETCLPWLTSYSRQACLGAAFDSSYSLCSCLRSLCPSLVVSPGWHSQTAPWIRFRCHFSLLLPPENNQGSYFSCTCGAEAYTPHSFSPAQNAFLVSCVLRFAPVCLHILSSLTAVDFCDPVTLALHLLALSLGVFNPGSIQ